MAALTLPPSRTMAERFRRARRRVPWWHVWWMGIAAVIFLVPLYSLVQFSFQGTTGHQPWYHWFQITFDDPAFRSSFWLSVQIALETTLAGLVLMVPTVFWVHLRLPRLRPVMEFIAVLPFVVPPIALIPGLLLFLEKVPWLLSKPEVLALIYVVFAMPFLYRSLDAGLRAMDLRTLTEASENLGASTLRTFFIVILPNLRSAIIAGSLLTVAIAMGEYTVASLLQFTTWPVWIYEINQQYAYQAAAVSVLSFLLTWLATLSLFLIGRGGQESAQMALTK